MESDKLFSVSDFVVCLNHEAQPISSTDSLCLVPGLLVP